MKCDQCHALTINGTFCHETRCPNTNSRWDEESETWIKQRKCFECGCTVDADDACCNAEQEDDRQYYMVVRYNVDEDGNVTEWELFDHGLDHPDYFPGYGTAMSTFDEVQVGIGDDAREALDDATDIMAQRDHDITNDQWNEMLAEAR